MSNIWWQERLIGESLKINMNDYVEYKFPESYALAEDCL